MSDLFQFIASHVEQAHYIFFGLLMLAGLNVPISEDLLLLSAGALASRFIPDQYWHLYLWVFIGCWISGWGPYWLGRIFGPKLLSLSWFNHMINQERIEKLHRYYEHWGIWTFILGRLIPGGIRNALFITSGMGKMDFMLFTARDFVAALISTNIVFYIGFVFGENYELLAEWVIRYNRVTLICALLLAIGASLLMRWKHRKMQRSHDHVP